MHVTHVPCLYPVPYLFKVSVKATVETHLILYARFLDGFQDRLNFLEVMVNGFLAEDMLARLGGLDGYG